MIKNKYAIGASHNDKKYGKRHLIYTPPLRKQASQPPWRLAFSSFTMSEGCDLFNVRGSVIVGAN